MRERLANLTNKYGCRVLYALCAFGLVWIDVVRCNGAGHEWQMAVNLTGFCILPVILCRFLKARKAVDGFGAVASTADGMQSAEKPGRGRWLLILVYGSWFLLSGICGILYYRAHAEYGSAYNPALAVGILEVVAYGSVAIALWRTLFAGKSNTKCTSAPLTVVFYLWMGMLAWCVLSVNEAIWPLWFLVMFGALFLQPASREDNEELLRGLADGIILGFFWVQGRALLYRPYDMPRYHGYFYNSNSNAMFYFLTYAAVLAKLSDIRRKDAACKGRKAGLLCFSLLAAVLCDLAIFSLGRSTMLTFFLTTLIWLICEERFFADRIFFLRFFRKGLALVLAAAVCFLPVYGAIRYVPALRHHPIWFWDEYDEQKSWRSFDGIDSDRFVSLPEFMDAFLGRMRSEDTEEVLKEYTSQLPGASEDREWMCAGAGDPAALLPESKTASLSGLLPLLTRTSVSTASAVALPSRTEGSGGKVLAYADGVTPGRDAEHPLYLTLPSFPGERILGIRAAIYGYVISELNLFGHVPVYPDVWLLPGFHLLHAHNGFLQMAYNFGIPAGLLLLLLNLWVIIRVLRRLLRKEGGWQGVFVLTVQLGFFLQGLTENPLFPGRSLLLFFFLTLLPEIRERKPSEERSAE
jgi:O-antigen ligase